MSESVTTTHQQGKPGDHDRETESQQQRVDHTSEARRIKEPVGRQKVKNKESVTPGRRIQKP